MKLTRREWAGALVVPAAALAQAPPAMADEALEKAREEQRRESVAIAKLDVPIETEPALFFRP
ncbi:MAG TPA: hypothetical protein VN428_14620 [Bryobacteraceae bacterium]|nr:hypothetical protein [Bryobacteraceae bacterium]